jgi:queuosine precursor transporter
MNKISENRPSIEAGDDDLQDDFRPLRFYDVLTVLAATVAVCTNILALKVTQVGPFKFSAAVIFFPITYILGDVLTEVYGFKRARRSIWLSFGAMLFAAVMSFAVLQLPPASDKLEIHEHFKAVFSATPRILCASFLAYLVGDFLNSIVLARLKVIDQGRGFWKRAILSTVVGQAADSLIFYPLAFSGIWEWSLIGRIMVLQYCLKVGIEVFGVPFSSWLVAFLKRVEGVDYYDRKTDFNPFGLSVDGADERKHNDID